MKLPDANEMRAIDGRAIKTFRMNSVQLMENAGRELARFIIEDIASLPGADKRVAIIAGKGNNGGDGFVAARHLANSGIDVSVYLAASVKDLKNDAALNARIWLNMGEKVCPLRSAGDVKKAKAEIIAAGTPVVVDALFGTGLKEPVKGHYKKAVDMINSLGARVVSVDVPSGIDATTGAILGSAVRADRTVTMALPKLGMYLYPGAGQCGRISVADIGVPGVLLNDDRIKAALTTEDDVRRIFVARRVDSHKGSNGHVLVVAGSSGKSGAAYMAAMGALRAGAGLVTLAVPAGIADQIEAKSAELMFLRLPENIEKTICRESCAEIKAALKGKSALVIGPGLGRGSEVASAVYKTLELAADEGFPVVIDADAVVALGIDTGRLKRSCIRAIMTPHPGEMAKISGLTIDEVQSDRIGAARRAAKKSGAVVLLKGAYTVIAAPDGRVRINPTGNVALATAGTGDVLSGMLGAFASQKTDLFDAAALGAFIHGAAADNYSADAGRTGMIATDLLSRIPYELGNYNMRSGKGYAGNRGFENKVS